MCQWTGTDYWWCCSQVETCIDLLIVAKSWRSVAPIIDTEMCQWIETDSWWCCSQVETCIDLLIVAKSWRSVAPIIDTEMCQWIETDSWWCCSQVETCIDLLIVAKSWRSVAPIIDTEMCQWIGTDSWWCCSQAETCTSSSSSVFPTYTSGVHQFGWDFCVCDPFFFYPTIEVDTFRLHGWCMLGVFLLPAFILSRTWTAGSFECVRWNACVHRLDLGLYSHPKEILGNGVRTILSPWEKSSLPEKFSSEEDQTHDDASSTTASPTRYQWAIPAPQTCTNLLIMAKSWRSVAPITDTDQHDKPSLVMLNDVLQSADQN